MSDAPTSDASSAGTNSTETASPDTIGWDCIALDCADPAGVAQFYADLLGGQVKADPDGDWFDVLWAGPRIATQLAPDHESPDWPRGQQQAHLDFVVVDIAAAHERVLALGGTALDPTSPPQPAPDRGFRVYADPAGHPFCLCRPTEDAWG